MAGELCRARTGSHSVATLFHPPHEHPHSPHELSRARPYVPGLRKCIFLTLARRAAFVPRQLALRTLPRPYTTSAWSLSRPRRQLTSVQWPAAVATSRRVLGAVSHPNRTRALTRTVTYSLYTRKSCVLSCEWLRVCTGVSAVCGGAPL